MWLITTFGFFSIHIPIYPERNELLREVRARKREHIEELRKRYCPKLGPTIETPTSDYPFRAQATVEELAEAMADLTKDMEHSNFKDSIEDEELHDLCFDIWSDARLALDKRYRVHRSQRRFR